MTVLAVNDNALEPLGPVVKVCLAAEIVVSYLLARWHLGRKPLPAVVGTLRTPLSRLAHNDDAVLETWVGLRLARAVIRTLSVLPADSRCLMRSLVLTRLLARRGIHSQLIIGVHTHGDFLGHAWVEHQGMALLPLEGTSDQRLVEL